MRLNLRQVARLIQQLRAAIDASEMTRYEIAKRAGVPNSTLSRIMSGERQGVSFETLEKLCEVLGLELTPTTSPTAKRRKA